MAAENAPKFIFTAGCKMRKKNYLKTLLKNIHKKG
jgi:hypothetical protein